MTVDGSMKVGEVRVAKAEDFEQFRRLAESTEKWSLLYDKHGIKVYSKFTEGTSVKMMKVCSWTQTLLVAHVNNLHLK
jgi:hypothetical protein